MITDYRYKLEDRKLTGRRQQKTMCPHCGRKSLVRYVDTHNQYCYLSDVVGRCDHENSCGYHYTPREYFDDNPWLKDGPAQICAHLPPLHRPLTPPPPLQPLSTELVGKYHSPQSNFWQWLSGKCAQKLNLDPDVLLHLYEDYRIGAMEKEEVIFWQIDERQRVRSGHIMQYGTDGHRRGYQSWMHSKLIEQGQLSEKWPLYQCFFGQHLLSDYPDKQVCLVESEKTALIMAARFPDYLWLATCGSNGLNTEKLECLRGRRFTLFPDSGCFEKWQAIMLQTEGLQYTIDDSLEVYPPNTDLADVILQ